MNIIISIIIFCIVLFIYLHLNYHIATSNDLEIYELDSPWSKLSLDNVCYNKQPVKFNFTNNEILEQLNLSYVENQYNAFDIKIRNIKENEKNKQLYLPFSVGELPKLLEKNETNEYITENNNDFLTETNLVKTFKHNDDILRPPMVSHCNYDFCCGGADTVTPLQYKLNYRNYILVTEGEITIKLISPEYTKYLHLNKDYDNFIFDSPINVWDIQEQYKTNYNKVKSLELVLKQNDIIYIPPYWWYSIRFNNISSLAIFNYKTYMSTISILPDLFINFLQNQNIKFKMNNILELS
jgi:hypothetical protein